MAAIVMSPDVTTPTEMLIQVNGIYYFPQQIFSDHAHTFSKL